MDTQHTKLITEKRRVGNGLLEVLAWLHQAVLEWHRRRKTLRELMALDDHLLEDIGFRRDEVLKVLHSGDQPKRIDWMSTKTPHTTQRHGPHCPFCGAPTVGRPCSM